MESIRGEIERNIVGPYLKKVTVDLIKKTNYFFFIIIGQRNFKSVFLANKPNFPKINEYSFRGARINYGATVSICIVYFASAYPPPLALPPSILTSHST